MDVITSRDLAMMTKFLPSLLLFVLVMGRNYALYNFSSSGDDVFLRHIRYSNLYNEGKAIRFSAL